MASDDDDFPLTEPVAIPCPIVMGFLIDRGPHVVTFVGWTVMQRVRGMAEERRVSTRFAMPIDTAMWFREKLDEIVPDDSWSAENGDGQPLPKSTDEDLST